MYLENKENLINKGITQLLEIKDAEIRLLSLYQCRHAIDNGIHIGGAFSATIPMVSLFYGGIIDVNIENPTAIDQDQFVLSKGHAVATLASIYADLGYFDKEILKNSRSISSVLNGHPGPVLPGVHVATGPMGQGMGVAQGFAIAGQQTTNFDVYALTGDGELQEGPIWEAVMFAGAKRLENLCVMVDNNGGQLDIVSSLHFPYHNLRANFESFGWRVLEIDATQYHTVYEALHQFKYQPRDGRPTAIICKSTKGHGGFSNLMNNHKSTLGAELLDQEEAFHKNTRAQKEKAFCNFFNKILKEVNLSEVTNVLEQHAQQMGFALNLDGSELKKVSNIPAKVKLKKADVRNKKIEYKSEKLPKLEHGKLYAADKVIESAMKIFALDERIFSIDSDLASTSGLQSGVGHVDKRRALNVGVAEANMMLIGEALSVLGSNVWVSTFCPFFDWKILRRIAVGHQERLEIIESKGWLSEGHGIDYTMVVTAADLDTQSNGATHMGNDDALLMNEAAHVNIINVSCPQQLLSIMKWIVEGNKGIIYLRILRAPSKVIYNADFKFEFGKSYPVVQRDKVHAYIVTSGRSVFESMDASDILLADGFGVNIIDMPSIDSNTIIELYNTGKPIFIAEQNNGYLWTNFRKVLFSNLESINTKNIHPINLTVDGEINYIHSGTYSELAEHYGLNADRLSKQILNILKS
ncbi:transketolase [Confluentibacter flavum]|uniref:Transketolase n=1 Tax=Confluentibacter flavum TaxID=1909700 RepID=A0A2N3HP93_9FLAO|nr:transketolase [Confluentibacter flavum]